MKVAASRRVASGLLPGADIDAVNLKSQDMKQLPNATELNDGLKPVSAESFRRRAAPITEPAFRVIAV